jgi:hypothetical protein
MAPKRNQWENSSLYSQAYNCGPTCITQIACFYRDTYLGVEATRKIIAGTGPYNVTGVGDTVYGAPQGTPTTAWQQAEMLRKRGIGAKVFQIDSLPELRDLLKTGRRPVLIGIEMIRVPPSIRDHPFTGWHAVLVLASTLGGFWITDPNFNPPWRPDPENGRKWYPDAVLQYAFINNAPRWSVIPDHPKVIAIPDTATEEPDVYEWIPKMTHQIPKVAVVRTGTTLLKNPDGTKHYTLTSQTEVEVIGSLAVGKQYWVGRRKKGPGLFLVPDAGVAKWL